MKRLFLLSFCLVQMSFAQSPCAKLYNEAYQLITDQKYENAVLKLEKALQIDTLGNCGTQAAGKVQNELGYAHMRLGHYDLSREYFEASIALNPRNPDPRLNKASSYILEKDMENAIAVLDEFILELPGYPWAYWQRGNLREHGGDVDGALADYRQAKIHNDQVNLLPKVLVDKIEKKLKQ